MDKESKHLTPHEQSWLARMRAALGCAGNVVLVKEGHYAEEEIEEEDDRLEGLVYNLNRAKEEGLRYELLHEALSLFYTIPSLEEMGLKEKKK